MKLNFLYNRGDNWVEILHRETTKEMPSNETNRKIVSQLEMELRFSKD